MAFNSVDNIHGVAARGQNPATPYADPNQLSVAAMRTRLTAISATNYSVARLRNMTANDMAYAIRLADFAGTV